MKPHRRHQRKRSRIKNQTRVKNPACSNSNQRVRTKILARNPNRTIPRRAKKRMFMAKGTVRSTPEIRVTTKPAAPWARPRRLERRVFTWRPIKRARRLRHPTESGDDQPISKLTPLSPASVTPKNCCHHSVDDCILRVGTDSCGTDCGSTGSHEDRV